MKMDDIQRLLLKYQEGSLSSDEQAELDCLTQKSEVLASAFQKADGIVHRRHMRHLALAVSALVLLGVGVWVAMPQQNTLAPLVAEAQMDSPVADEAPMPEEVLQTAAVAESPVADEPMHLAAVFVDEQVESAPQPDIAVHTPSTPVSQGKTVVVCNTQCEADSVISKIWKFLSA